MDYEFMCAWFIQMVVMQCILWYNVLVFFFEYRAAKMLVMKCFRKTAASIASFRVESDVVSLGHHDILETESEIGDDGMLHVTVKKAISSRQSLGPRSFSVPNTGRNPQLQSQAHSQSERHPQRLILSQSNRRPIANDSHVFVESTRISHVPETGGPPASSSAHFDAWEESGRSVPHVNEIKTVATDKGVIKCRVLILSF
ncbi:Peptidyl-prolyl cis-trans isomerase pin4 [Sarracenia purpurea var. burkii]